MDLTYARPEAGPHGLRRHGPLAPPSSPASAKTEDSRIRLQTENCATVPMEDLGSNSPTTQEVKQQQSRAAMLILPAYIPTPWECNRPHYLVQSAYTYYVRYLLRELRKWGWPPEYIALGPIDNYEGVPTISYLNPNSRRLIVDAYDVAKRRVHESRARSWFGWDAVVPPRYSDEPWDEVAVSRHQYTGPSVDEGGAVPMDKDTYEYARVVYASLLRVVWPGPVTKRHIASITCDPRWTEEFVRVVRDPVARGYLTDYANTKNCGYNENGATPFELWSFKSDIMVSLAFLARREKEKEKERSIPIIEEEASSSS